MTEQNRFQVLIATMHQEDHGLLERMQVDSDAVVINQCHRESEETLSFRGHKIHWINTMERGLSKSRNMALRAATAEICLICDDDEILAQDYAKTVTDAFAAQPGADICRFQVRGIEKPFKKYSENPGQLGFLGAMRVSSVEIAFRRTAVLATGNRFDERIGAGTEFLMGEESAFLFACLREKLKLFYVPQVIADLHMGDSTWFTGYNEKNFIGRGAAFTAMSPRWAWLLMAQFAVRKYKKYKDEISMIAAVRAMIKGRKAYLTQGENHDT